MNFNWSPSPEELAKYEKNFYVNAAALGKPRFSRSRAGNLGTIHIVCGVFALIFGIICIYFSFYSKYSYSEIGSGFWCGLIFFAAGFSGILSGRQKQKSRMIVAYLVLSLVAYSSALYLLCKSSSNIYIIQQVLKDQVEEPLNQDLLELAANGILAAFAILEIIISISSLVACCEEVNALCTGHLFPHMLYVPGPCFIDPKGRMLPISGTTGQSTIGPINPLVMHLKPPRGKETPV